MKNQTEEFKQIHVKEIVRVFLACFGGLGIILLQEKSSTFSQIFNDQLHSRNKIKIFLI